MFQPKRSKISGVRVTVSYSLLIGFLFMAFVFPSSRAPAAESAPGELKIARIVPSGADVPAGRQIVFEFNRPVVPLGRMERGQSEIPIAIEPPLSCQWRWLNSSNLACQLDERHAMAQATRYSITVEPGIKAEDGAALAGPVTHGFITQRPKVNFAEFQTWLSPVSPQFRVRFDQPVQKISLEAHAWFKAKESARIGAKVLEDPTYSKSSPGLNWLISPVSDLAADRDGELVIEPGILSTHGPEPGIENRTVASFHTLPQFRFAGIACKDLKGRDLLFGPDSHAAAQARCNPTDSISVLFSSPVLLDELREKVSIAPVGTTENVSGPWPDYQGYSMRGEAMGKGKPYSYMLENDQIKPFAQYRIHAKANSIKDEFGRPLAKAIDMRFATDHMPPDLHLFKNSSVLEKGLDTDLPILATNLDQIKMTYETLTTEGKSPPQTQIIPGPRTRDVAVPIALQLRKLISKDSGVVSGTFSPRPAKKETEEEPRWFFAQVTPFDVHVKLGHFSTLVWITDLQSGRPVPGVEVRIQKDTLKELGVSPEVLSKAVTDSGGAAELPGTSRLDPSLKLSGEVKREQPWLFVWCRKDTDVAVVPLRYDFQVDTEGSNHEYIPSWQRSLHGHIRAWGATAQGIYKVGDTVQYKLYVRDQGNRRFILPPPGSYRIKVTDPTSRVVFQRDDIKLSEFGALDGEFPIPKNGAVGWYKFSLESDFAKLDLEPLQVLVSDFTPSPFHVTTELNGNLFGEGDTVTLSTQAKLHAGGPYGRAAAGITATVEAVDFRPQKAPARDFQFDVTDKEKEDERTVGVATVFESRGRLDDDGNLETRFALAELPVYYGRLTVEGSVRDERGKSVASRATASCFGRDRYVGLLQSDWLLQEGNPAKTAFIVVDQNGETVPGVETIVEVEKLQIKAARVKDAGDAYPTQYAKEWVPVESFKFVSGDEPGNFEFTPQESGTIRLIARVTDSKGRIHKTVMRRWVSGKSRVLWETGEGNLLNLYTEKEEYRVGDTVRVFVQNPYPGANALVTVERYGVLDHWVKKLDNSAEVIEIPVRPDYLPGFYVSVMVMSPRVAQPLGPGGEDLGKPAFRMGYAKLEVKDQFKEIQVQCTSDKEGYKPRDTVKLAFDARPKNLDAGEKSPPIEIAVAVLDEAVFDLLKQKRDAFDPYKGFYKLEELDLTNYNLIMQLVGREKLEKKGASPAAAAGFDLSMRSVFKFVSYWNPSLRVDENGKASVEFQLPDNLTGWRVLAMAVTPDDRMGLGEYTFKENQLTEIRPVLPNQVLEEDGFSAGFSVMNRTGETRNIEVKIAAEGPVVPGEGTAAGGAEIGITQTITAEPYKRYTVRLPLKATGAGEIVFTVQAGDERDKDAMRHVLKVMPRLSRDVAAAYGSIAAGEASEKIEFPAGMRPGSGLLGVGFAPSILGGLEGAFDFMKAYPFECWEQKISRAVMAGAFQKLAPYLPKTFSWENSAAEADKILAAAVEFQAPNGGMAFYQARDDYVSPFLSAFTARAFNWLRESGHTPPAQVEEKLLKYLQDLLKRDEPGGAASRNVLSDVRALALAALAERGKVSRADLERHWKHFPEMNLFGKATFLEALSKVPETEQMRLEVLRDIMSHADQSSGSIRFTEPADSALGFMLASTVRDNAAILMAFLCCTGSAPSPELGDMPARLMQTIAHSRKGRNHWASTQENLYAAMASLRFSRTYETGNPPIRFQALLDQQVLGEGRFESVTDKAVKFDYPVPAGDLGRKAAVIARKEGEGRLYYETVLSYTPAHMAEEALNAGIEIQREYSVDREGRWVLLQNPLEVKTGELVRVDLFVSLPAERWFVLVEDPVPGGLEPVSGELATSSEADVRKGESSVPAESIRNRYSDWRSFGISRWSFYHKELRHSAARFYSERLSAGHYLLSYTAQVIAPGSFTALPARAEEMYDPDVFGKSAPALLRVELAE